MAERSAEEEAHRAVLAVMLADFILAGLPDDPQEAHYLRQVIFDTFETAPGLENLAREAADHIHLRLNAFHLDEVSYRAVLASLAEDCLARPDLTLNAPDAHEVVNDLFDVVPWPDKQAVRSR